MPKPQGYWEAVIVLAPFWRGQSGGLSRSGGPPNLAPAGRQSGGPNLARVWPIWRVSLKLEIAWRNHSGEMPNLANAFSEVMLSQEKAPARNAHLITLVFSEVIFPEETNAPARNADLVALAFSRSCFPREQKPLPVTLTRSPWLFPGHGFARKQKPLLGTLTWSPWHFSGHVFPRKQKPLLGTLT